MKQQLHRNQKKGGHGNTSRDGNLSNLLKVGADFSIPSIAREAIIESFGVSVKAMLPLARLLESSNFSPEERARVRDIAGRDGVVQLVNVMSRLCGERSLRLIQSSEYRNQHGVRNSPPDHANPNFS